MLGIIRGDGNYLGNTPRRHRSETSANPDFIRNKCRYCPPGPVQKRAGRKHPACRSCGRPENQEKGRGMSPGPIPGRSPDLYRDLGHSDRLVGNLGRWSAAQRNQGRMDTRPNRHHLDINRNYSFYKPRCGSAGGCMDDRHLCRYFRRASDIFGL